MDTEYPWTLTPNDYLDFRLYQGSYGKSILQLAEVAGNVRTTRDWPGLRGILVVAIDSPHVRSLYLAASSLGQEIVRAKRAAIRGSEAPSQGPTQIR